jgi:hypothetical protein
MTASVTREQRAKINYAFDEMLAEVFENAERLLKLPAARLDYGERLDRVRETILALLEDDPDRQDDFRFMTPDQLFDNLVRANQEAKRLRN